MKKKYNNFASASQAVHWFSRNVKEVFSLREIYEYYEVDTKHTSMPNALLRLQRKNILIPSDPKKPYGKNYKKMDTLFKIKNVY